MNLEKIKNLTDLYQKFTKAESILDLSGVMYVAVDVEGKVIFANNKVSEITELKKEDIIGKKLFDQFLPNDIKDDVFLNFKKILTGEKKFDKHNEISILTKNGIKKTISWYNKLIRDEKGKIIAFLSSGIDITEQVKAKEQALQNLNMLETLINSIPDIVCYKDGKGRWLLANKADLELFCLTDVDYYGKTDAELAEYTNPIYKDAFSACMITDENAWKKENVSNEIEIIPTTNGEEKIFDVYKIPIFKPNGERLSLVVIGRDITEIKKNEQKINKQNIKLQKLITERNKLFSIVSHDLRNPFNILIGFSGLLKDNYQKYSNDKIEEFLNAIYTTSVNTHKLLENILTWSKTQTKQILFNPKEYSTEKLLKENINQVSSNLKQKNIKIFYQINNKTIFADKNLLNTIIRNLLTNAIKFTQNGGEIILKTYTEKLYTIITVTDNGVGMTKEQQKNIFQLNKQASTNGTNNESGSGLGLVLCKELVKKHKGKIWVKSKKGVGSTFFISIPNK